MEMLRLKFQVIKSYKETNKKLLIKFMLRLKIIENKKDKNSFNSPKILQKDSILIKMTLKLRLKEFSSL